MCHWRIEKQTVVLVGKLKHIRRHWRIKKQTVVLVVKLKHIHLYELLIIIIIFGLLQAGTAIFPLPCTAENANDTTLGKNI